ncbi:MAG: leucine--tRNA ligase, partial [Bacteroidetes bacterium HGW-Bacteroidetes-17]
MKAYDFRVIEEKWQKRWEENKSFIAEDFSDKPKYYILSEFFGPSGKGIHLGHIKCYTPTEVIARYMRLKGYNVLYPAGWDAFGLPTENFAIKTGEQPSDVTERNIGIFKYQLRKMGYSFDWHREICTSYEDYYRWTQWIFLQLFKKGLAYKSEGVVNFCPSCMTVLSNEDSQGGECDRCHGRVVQEKRSVWYLRMRDYSEKILNGVDEIDMKESLKDSQRNWIGKSVGAEILFCIKDINEKLEVFTTRPDTLFGATFIVIAPEHPLANHPSILNVEEVHAYQKLASEKSMLDRRTLKEKTGMQLKRIIAINPINQTELPIFIADYVLMGYGTGAIMAVPGHDDRDWEFAHKHNLPIVEVIAGGDISKSAYTDDGVLINSGFLNGLCTEDAKDVIIGKLEEQHQGIKTLNYRIQDWAFNRQRYWGEPFPIVICDECGYVPISERNLPVILPKTTDFTPDKSGNSPLSKLSDWVNCTCPKCGKPAKRETDTMPNWAGSSWYWLRFIDPQNSHAFVGKDKLNYWGAVDLYTGGTEHVTRHMLYASFWHNFLYDIGAVPHKLPFTRRMCNGLILDGEGKKMSKSSENAIDPLDVVAQYGADAFRLHMLFIGEYEQNTLWSLDGIVGIQRFLNSVWAFQNIMRKADIISEKHAFELNSLLKRYVSTIIDTNQTHHTYESHNDFKFNTIIAAMMTFVNSIKSDGWISREEYRQLLIMLNPFAPHITSEIYETVFGVDILTAAFPEYDDSKTILSSYNLPVQLNGKMKGTVQVPN